MKRLLSPLTICSRNQRAPGTSLIEFAIVAPLLVLLVIGGISLFVRVTFRDSLDEAAEQAAWAAARTGGDAAAIQQAIARSAPFIPAGQMRTCVQSAGYHTDVSVRVDYTGAAVTTLPFFNEPLDPSYAIATNQQERSFSVGSCSAAGVTAVNALAPDNADQSSLSTASGGDGQALSDTMGGGARAVVGPASWPLGPASMPSP